MEWKRREKAQNYPCMKSGAEAAGICAQVGFRAGVREKTEKKPIIFREFNRILQNISSLALVSQTVKRSWSSLCLHSVSVRAAPLLTSHSSMTLCPAPRILKSQPCYQSLFQIISYCTSKVWLSTLAKSNILGVKGKKGIIWHERGKIQHRVLKTYPGCSSLSFTLLHSHFQ